MIDKLKHLHQREVKMLEWLKSPLLLLIRLAWGYQFAISGWGKLGNIDGVTKYFTKLDIPAPAFNAWLVACTELVGGTLLALGLASRVTPIPLIIAMTVALVTEWGPVKGAESGWDTFTGNVLDATAFPFLVASWIVLVFGGGALSVDGLVSKLGGK